MVFDVTNSFQIHLVGNSTDTKPTDAELPYMETGSCFYEMDTKKKYQWYKEPEQVGTWYPQKSASIGHKVTFIVGNTTKYVYDVADGESISEPPTPSESGKVWLGWYDTNSSQTGNKISFPYTPTADIALYGIFNTVV